jgi:hypothetical protein
MGTNGSQKHAASIFRVEEDGGRRVIQNVDTICQTCVATHPRKTSIDIKLLFELSVIIVRYG